MPAAQRLLAIPVHASRALTFRCVCIAEVCDVRHASRTLLCASGVVSSACSSALVKRL